MIKTKKLYVIYTGGTIGMKKSNAGYIPEAGLLTKLMHDMPEFKHNDMPHYVIHEYKPLIDSANMQITDWEKIAQDIKNNYDKYDGFIVLHGTDTMAYTASALSFIFKKLSKPVILTGSQVPLMEVHTDARENLIMAMMIAANYQIPEVCIYFNNRLLRGNRAQKVNAFSFAAFDSPNFPALAEIGVNINLRKDLILNKPIQNKTLEIIPLQTLAIRQVMLFPGFDFMTLNDLASQPIKALILHTYGQGNAPTANPALLKGLKKLITNNIMIINYTQCHQGGVEMKSYATGEALRELGILSSHDMTIEAIISKLIVLFSQDSTQSQIAQLFEQNIAGELYNPKQ